jgi:hypothetical protein
VAARMTGYIALAMEEKEENEENEEEERMNL